MKIFFIISILIFLYMFSCILLQKCYQAIDEDKGKAVFIPIYNIYLFIELGDDFADGMLLLFNKFLIDRSTIVIGYLFSLIAVIVSSMTGKFVNGSIILLIVINTIMNLSVTSTLKDIKLADAIIELDARAFWAIIVSILGALPGLFIGRIYILLEYLNAAKNGKLYFQDEMEFGEN